MSKSFDFNAITQQTFRTTLNDEAKTVLHVTTPPERLIEQIAASQDEINSLMGGDQHVEKVRASYRLAADIISCNVEGVTITAEELRDKYRVPPIALSAYLAAYMDFINEFHNAKN